MPNDNDRSLEEFGLIGDSAGEQRDNRGGSERTGEGGRSSGSNVTVSPFDVVVSRHLEDILAWADSSQDFALGRRELVDLIEKNGLHEHKETIFRERKEMMLSVLVWADRTEVRQEK